MSSTTIEDAVELYRAIEIAKPGGLGAVDRYDANLKSSIQEIKDDGITLYELMELSSSWDSIAKEWVTGMKVTFDVGFPTVVQTFEETNDINAAVSQTFLKILSEYPDTLIARKINFETAEQVSELAKSAYSAGGVLTHRGYMKVREMDNKLREYGPKMNPGTTADITAASTMVALLANLRF